MLGDFLAQLTTRLPEWSAGGLLDCCDVGPYFAVRVSCRSPNSMSLTRTTCCGKSLASSFDARFPCDILATFKRRCYEETAPVEFQRIGDYGAATCTCNSAATEILVLLQVCRQTGRSSGDR